LIILAFLVTLFVARFRQIKLAARQLLGARKYFLQRGAMLALQALY